jgi:exopolyphosphatase/guanosine-5'-triphosphate,3'-diphosphate pyrophosphatase
MQLVRRAVIDVGTNSIKLLVADVAGRDVRPVWEESRQTRLGRGFYETHRLQAGAITSTAQAVGDFAATARRQNAAAVRVIATSAARDAVNPEELIAAIERATGLNVEIISGEREADWVYQGVTTDPRLAGKAILLLDVGGGSTEFILGRGEAKHFRQSFPLGTVRMMEEFPPHDPPQPQELAERRRWLKGFLAGEVRPSLDPALRRELDARARDGGVQLVGTGGTASVLACMEAELRSYDRKRIEAARLSLERVRARVGKLWSLPLEERKKIAGLPPNRADVILMGAAIYEAIMEGLGFPELRVSTRGLRFAAVMEG